MTVFKTAWSRNKGNKTSKQWRGGGSRWSWWTESGTSERQSDSGRCCGDKEREARLRWFRGTVDVQLEWFWRCTWTTGRLKSTFKHDFGKKKSFISFSWLMQSVLLHMQWRNALLLQVHYQCEINKGIFFFNKDAFRYSWSEVGHDHDTVQNNKYNTFEVAKHLLNKRDFQCWTSFFWQAVWTWTHKATLSFNQSSCSEFSAFNPLFQEENHINAYVVTAICKNIQLFEYIVFFRANSLKGKFGKQVR